MTSAAAGEKKKKKISFQHSPAGWKQSLRRCGVDMSRQGPADTHWMSGSSGVLSFLTILTKYCQNVERSSTGVPKINAQTFCQGQGAFTVSRRAALLNSDQI